MRSAPSRPAAVLLGIAAMLFGLLLAGMGCSDRSGGQAAPSDPAVGGASSPGDPASGSPGESMAGATGSTTGTASPGASATPGSRKANVYTPVPDIPEPPRSPNESP